MESTRTTRIASAAAAPSKAERHPRVTPTATTMVNASTISTALARKTETTRTMAALCTSASEKTVGRPRDARGHVPRVEGAQASLLILPRRANNANDMLTAPMPVTAANPSSRLRACQPDVISDRNAPRR